jgi:hypothetical protein
MGKATHAAVVSDELALAVLMLVVDKDNVNAAVRLIESDTVAGVDVLPIESVTTHCATPLRDDPGPMPLPVKVVVAAEGELIVIPLPPDAKVHAYPVYGGVPPLAVAVTLPVDRIEAAPVVDNTEGDTASEGLSTCSMLTGTVTIAVLLVTVSVTTHLAIPATGTPLVSPVAENVVEAKLLVVMVIPLPPDKNVHA